MSQGIPERKELTESIEAAKRNQNVGKALGYSPLDGASPPIKPLPVERRVQPVKFVSITSCACDDEIIMLYALDATGQLWQRRIGYGKWELSEMPVIKPTRVVVLANEIEIALKRDYESRLDMKAAIDCIISNYLREEINNNVD